MTPQTVLNALESSLTVDEGVTLYYDIFTKYASVSKSPVRAFVKLVVLMDMRLLIPSRPELKDLLRTASSSFEILDNYMTSDSASPSVRKLFCSSVVLGLLTKNVSNLNWFRLNSIEVINLINEKANLKLDNHDKTIAKIFLTATMLYWIVIDQTDVDTRTRSEVRALNEAAMKSLSVTESVSMRWFSELHVEKYSAKSFEESSLTAVNDPAAVNLMNWLASRGIVPDTS